MNEGRNEMKWSEMKWNETNEQLQGWMNACMHEWMNEPTNQWINEKKMNEWIL